MTGSTTWEDFWKNTDFRRVAAGHAPEYKGPTGLIYKRGERNMNVKPRLTLALAAAAFTAVPAQTSLAQAGASDLALEEIIVRARKRDESLQEVPIAVDVITADRIAQLQIENVEDVARFTSGLYFDQGILPTDQRPVIRGVQSLRGRPNVGILVDFVDVSSEALTVAGGGLTTNVRLLDLEQVEVVKGPQSALYGRSAFTGAINYVTRRPGDTFEGEVRVTADEHNTTDVMLALGGPLGDTFGGRVMFSKYDTDGWYTNPNTNGKLGTADSTGASLALEWDPSDTVNAYFRVEHTDDKYSPRAEAAIESLSPLFNPAVNTFATGTVTDDAELFPHTGFGTTTCTAADRLTPYFDSFGAGPPCRPLIVGELHATQADIDLSPDPRSSSGADFPGTERQLTRYHFDINFDMPYADFSYILGYLDADTEMQEDFDKANSQAVSGFVPFPPPGFAFSQYGLSAMAHQRQTTEQWNHELRLTGESEKATWMLSLLNWNEEVNLAFDDEWWLREGASAAPVLAIFNGPGGPFNFLQQPVGPFPNLCFVVYPTDPGCVPMVQTLATSLGNTPAIPITRKTKHWSLAGTATINFTDRFAATVEARLLEETIDYTGDSADISFYSQFGADPYWGFLFGPGVPTSNSVDEDAFVPKITLDYRFNDNVLAYGYFSKAFKPGGVSTTDANGDVSTGEYKSEKLDVWELGLKTEMRDRSIRWNSAIFFYDYTDQQVPFQFFDPNTSLLQTSVVNAGKTEVKGFETDLIWRSAFLEGLSVGLSYTFTDAEFTDFNLAKILGPAGGSVSAFNRAKAGNDDGDFTGHTPPLTPEHAATWSLRYDANFSSGMNWYIEALGAYMSERFIGEGNRAWLPTHSIVDLYTGLGNDRWSLTIFVENVNDDDSIKSGLSNVDFTLLPDGRSLSQVAQLYLPQPRTMGARLQVNFGGN